MLIIGLGPSLSCTGRRVIKLIDVLDDDDDVHMVSGNYEIPDDVMEALA